MTIDDVIRNFNTTPFLFIGSGLSRRYLNLPDWKSLLQHFAEAISNDEFAYSSYKNAVGTEKPVMGYLPKVAELIQKDFDKKWFSDPTIRTISGDKLEMVKGGVSPFKAEVAGYIENFSVLNEKYNNEIERLKKLSEKNIAGVITTNYDTFIENNFSGYKTYVGQEELIFSAISGIAEIYKIHGSVSTPESIVINEQDYIRFNEKSSYLAAKLMTIFMEYPIIFLGYSISDSNVLNIIREIINCLNEEQVKALKNRFVFVEYNASVPTPYIDAHSIMIDDKQLTMRKITLSDFMPLFTAMEKKQSKIPAKLLRKFQQDFYDYTITGKPTGHLRIAYIEDQRINDEDLVLAIGKASELGLRGLSGITGDEWYRSIILNDLDFPADDLLEYAVPALAKTNSDRLPVNKYLKEATKDCSKAKEIAQKYTFDKIISNSLKKSRKHLRYTSVLQIWQHEKADNSIERATRLIATLPEKQINLEELEQVLLELFTKDKDILSHAEQLEKTNIRRLILIYDYLKWGKKEETPDSSICKQTPSGVPSV